MQDTEGKAKGLTAPDSVVKTWFHHPTHGAAFRKLMDSLNEKFGSAQDAASENKKRAGDGQAGPSTKKPKLDLPFLPHDSMAGSETLQACDITTARQ